MKILKLLLLFTFFIGSGQEKNIDPLKIISDEACKCISLINTDNPSKNKAIENCITSSIANNLSTEENKDKNDVSDAHTSPITNKSIETYLVENCESLKQLSFAENKEFKHSTSKNVLAQLAYDDGMDFLDQGDFEKAIIKFKKAVEIDTKFAFAWDNLGVSYRKINQFEKAIKAYKKSLEINPKGRLPLINIAVTYNLNKDFDAAIKYYNKFIGIYKDDPEGYYGLGLILYTNNKPEEGLDNLVHAYTIYSDQNSPYRADAAKKIGYMYNDLKNQNKLDVFNKVATKYNLKVESN
jgi:tetratricopeptide (TPR) repeat protein